MVREFDGQTEKEAVQNAIDALNIKNFEYEVISSTKKGLFKKSCVRIRVMVDDEPETGEAVEEKAAFAPDDDEDDEEIVTESVNGECETPEEEKMMDFLANLMKLMMFPVRPIITARGSTGKVYVNLECDDNSLLIGYRGERLDALQTVVSSYFLKITDDRKKRVILDSDGYRERHEGKILKDAMAIAKKVKQTGKPALLDPLNSYERRLVHKAVTEFGGLASESQGNGLMKRIKIFKV